MTKGAPRMTDEQKTHFQACSKPSATEMVVCYWFGFDSSLQTCRVYECWVFVTLCLSSVDSLLLHKKDEKNA